MRVLAPTSLLAEASRSPRRRPPAHLPAPAPTAASLAPPVAAADSSSARFGFPRRHLCFSRHSEASQQRPWPLCRTGRQRRWCHCPVRWMFSGLRVLESRRYDAGSNGAAVAGDGAGDTHVVWPCSVSHSHSASTSGYATRR